MSLKILLSHSSTLKVTQGHSFEITPLSRACVSSYTEIVEWLQGQCEQKFEDMFTRFNTINERDRRIDRQKERRTDTARQHSVARQQALHRTCSSFVNSFCFTVPANFSGTVFNRQNNALAVKSANCAWEYHQYCAKRSSIFVHNITFTKCTH